MNRYVRLFALISLGGVTACGNVRSRLVDLSTIPPKGPVGGSPFTLNKPEFTITHTKNADGTDAYTVSTGFVPDTSKRYITTLHPALLATVDWTQTYDAQGSLSETNAKTTDQTVAVVSSLAKFAAAFVTLDKFDADPVLSLDQFNRLFVQNLAHPKIYDREKRGLVGTTQKQALQLKRRWAGLYPVLQARARAGTLSDYAYQDDDEFILLMTALELDEDGHRTQAAGLRAKKNLGAMVGGPQYLMGELVAAFDRYDLNAILAIKAAAIKDQNTRIASLRLTDASTDAISKDTAVVNDRELALAASDAVDALKKRPNEVLLPIVTATPSVWAARRIQDLNLQIAERLSSVRVGALSSSPLAAPDPEIGDPALLTLYRRKAAVLGLTATYDQAVALGRTSATNPKTFAQAQTIRTTLLKTLADAEAALVTAKAAAVSDAPVVAEYVQWPDASEPSSALIVAQLKGLPQYVVVLKPILAPEGTLPVPPPGGGKVAIVKGGTAAGQQGSMTSQHSVQQPPVTIAPIQQPVPGSGGGNLLPLPPLPPIGGLPVQDPQTPIGTTQQ